MSDLAPLAVATKPLPEDLAVRDVVLFLAVQHAANEIDHWEVRRQCSGYDRYIAARSTALDDPARPALMRMLDDLIAQDPTQQYGWQYRTKQGLFSAAELSEAGAVMDRAGDRLLIRFPVRYGPHGPEFKARAA